MFQSSRARVHAWAPVSGLARGDAAGEDSYRSRSARDSPRFPDKIFVVMLCAPCHHCPDIYQLVMHLVALT